MFQKYNEIENTYRKKTIDEIYQTGLNGGDWVVEEKVHGANFSFIVNNDYIKTAKRTSILGDEENFYNSSSVFAKCRDKIIDLYKDIISCNTEVNNIIVYGEIFGGIYPHKDIEAVRGSSSVQKEVYYSPDNCFYGFDIKIFYGEKTEFLDVYKRNELFEKHGLFYAKPLFIGSLEDALNYPNKYQTTIPKLLGLPEIDNNICEGNVIKPVFDKRYLSGERVILKNKNDKFSEKRTDTPKINVEKVFSENVKKIIDDISSLINENRLHSVLSKIGKVTDKDFGLILGNLSKDIYDEYLKDNRDFFEKLEKNEQKMVGKSINMTVSKLIRDNFLNIIDGKF